METKRTSAFALVVDIYTENDTAQEIKDWNSLAATARLWHKRANEKRKEYTLPWTCNCPESTRQHSDAAVILIVFAFICTLFTIGSASPSWYLMVLLLTGASFWAETVATEKFHNPNRAWTTAELINYYLSFAVENACTFVEKETKLQRRRQKDLLRNLKQLKKRIVSLESFKTTPSEDEERTHTHMRRTLTCDESAYIQLDLYLDRTKEKARQLRLRHEALMSTVGCETYNRDVFTEDAIALLKSCDAVKKQALEIP